MLLWDTFFDAGETQLKNGKYKKAEQLLKSALGEADSFESDDPRLLKTLLALISVYQESKRPEDAVPLLKRCEGLLEEHPTTAPTDQSRVVEAQLAQLTFEEDDPKAVSALKQRLVLIWQAGGEAEQERLLESLLELSSSLRLSSSETDARGQLQKALAVAEEIHGKESEGVDRVLALLVESYVISQSFEEAEESGRRRLDIQTKLFGEDDERLAPTLADLSFAIEKQRRMEEALPLIERASSIHGEERTFFYLGFVEALLRSGAAAEALAKLITLEKGSVQGDLAGRYELLLLRAYQGVEDWSALTEQAERISNDPEATDLARLEAFVVRCERSEHKDEGHVGPYLDEILALDSEELDESGDLLARVANLTRASGRREISETFFDRAIQARTKDLDTNDPQSVKVLYELGTIQEKRRLLPDAVSSWERSLEFLRRHNGQVDSPAEERRMRIQLVEKLADLYIRQRRWERAEQAWRSLVRSTPATSPEHAKGRLGLTQVYCGLGDHKKALEYLLSAESGTFDETQCGRKISDTAFLLEILNLIEVGKKDEAVKKRDIRFSRRGGSETASISELYASLLVARSSREEARFTEDSQALGRLQPDDANEQLLVSKFYVLLAENNTRYYPPEPMPLDLTPLQALGKAVFWATEGNGEQALVVAELYEESAKAAVAESAWEEAESATRKSLELYELLKGAGSPLLLSSLQRLGELQLGKGQLDDAIDSLEQAIGLAEKHLTPQDGQVRELLRSLVEAHRRRGEFEKSRDYLNQLLGKYDEFKELGVEGKLDDLMRGIRLLLGDDGDHKSSLSAYLDEATELAVARGVAAELSLAFCLGQKARLVSPEDPDLAISLLRKQGTTLEVREEAPEFTADQLLLARLLLFRGQPKSTLALLKRLGGGEEPVPLRKSEWTRESRILETKALFLLHKFDAVGQELDELVILVHDEDCKESSQKAEVAALKLKLYHQKPDLIGDEEGGAAYAELEQIVDSGDWAELKAKHLVREKRDWELARLSFETRKLAPEESRERLSEQVNLLWKEKNEYPGALADALAQLGAFEATMDLTNEAYDHFCDARKNYEESGDESSLLRARAVAEVGRLAEALGHQEAAVEAYQSAIRGLEIHLGSRHKTLVGLHLGLGRLGRAMKELSASESALDQAMLVMNESEEELPILLRSDVLRELAALYTEQKRHRESREAWVQLREMWEDAGELIPTEWMEGFGLALVADDAFAEALQFFLDTLPLRLDQGEDSILLALYARWLEMTKDCEPFELAQESANHLLEVREVVHSALGEEPEPEFEVLWSRILVGFGQLHLANLSDDPESIKVDLEESLRLREAHLGPESQEVGEVLSLRAELAFAEEDLTTAESCLTRALNIVESNLGPDTWEVAEILLKLATVYFKKQRFSPTEAVLQRTLELCRTLLAENDSRWIKVCHLRGKLSLELGRPAEAFGSLDRALTLCKRHLRAPGRSLLIAAGTACLRTERSDRALELFTKAEAHFATDLEDWDEETEEVKLALGELLLERDRFEEADERLQKVLARQEKRFGYGDPNLGRAYRALGRCSSGLGDLDTAEERLEIALALQEEDLFNPLDLFSPFYYLATQHRDLGAEERATAILEENLDRARPSGRHEKVAQMAHLLAESREKRGELGPAEESWRETIESLETALEVVADENKSRVYENLLEPLERLARLLTSHRRYTAAEELTKKRLKYTELLKPEDTVTAQVHFDLAELYRVQELHKEAEEIHQEVLATRTSKLGKEHPDVATSLRALGQIALSQKDAELAGSFLNKAKDQQERELGEKHPDLADTLFSLGDLALLQKDFASAEDFYRRALDLLEENFGEANFRTAKAWTALAKLFEKKQQWSKAQPLLGRAVESVEAVLGPSHLDVADLLEKTATVYLVSGAVDQVAEPLERAFEIRRDSLGEDHPATARILKLQGEHNALLGDLKTARRLLGRADNIIAEFHGAESPVRFPYRFKFASSLRKLREFEQAESHFGVLMEQIEGDDQASLLKIADLKEELALLKLAQGNVTGAERTIKDALDTRSKFLSPNSEGVSSAFETLARIHQADGREVTASALAERALDALDIDDENIEGRATGVVSRARIQILLSRIELDGGGTSQASVHANQALNLLRDLLGDQHPDVAGVLHLLGEIARADRKLEKAEAYFEESLQKWEAFFGGSHYQVCRAVSSLAQLYQQQGRLTLAEQYHQRNLVALEGRFGAENPNLVDTLLGLGKLCRSQGNVTEAEGYLKRGAEIQGNVGEGSDLKMAEVLHTLALVYQDQRNFIAAEALLKKARDLRSKLAEDDSPEIAESNLALARLYRTSGKSQEAEPLLKSVLEWRSERLGEEHPEVASLLREMAELYADQKEYLKAQSLVRKALGIYGEALGHRNLELVGPLRQLARLLDASGDSEEADKQRSLAEELMGAG